MGQPQPYQSTWGLTVPTTLETVPGGLLIRQTFYVDVAATLYAARFYRDRSDAGNHVGILVRRDTGNGRDGQRAAAFVRNPANVGVFGWNNKYLGQPLDLVAGDWWDLVVWTTSGLYYDNPGGLVGADVVSGIIHVPMDGSTDPHGTVINNGARSGAAVNFNPNTTLGGPLLAIDILVLPK